MNAAPLKHIHISESSQNVTLEIQGGRHICTVSVSEPDGRVSDKGNVSVPRVHPSALLVAFYFEFQSRCQTSQDVCQPEMLEAASTSPTLNSITVKGEKDSLCVLYI